MTTARSITAIVFCLLLVGTTASAQVPGLIHLGVAAGRSFPTGDVKDALQEGFVGQAIVSVDLPMIPVGFRGAASYERFDLKGGDVGVEGNAKILSGTANALLSFPMGPLHPYITGGIGTYRLTSDLPGDGGSSKSETRFGVNGGAGVELRFIVVRAFAEARVENIFTDRGFHVGSGSGGSTRILPVTVGVIF